MNNLSNERLKEKIRHANELLSHEHEAVRIHAEENVAVLTELLAYREAAGKPVAYIDNDELERLADSDSGVVRTPKFGAGYQSATIPLYRVPQLPAVPDGWTLVPLEATPEMLGASWIHHDIHAPNAWRTMVAAAPKPNSET